MEITLIGNKIAEARKKANISQAQLAGQLFISPQAVGKWERGESLPDILNINRMAEILGVDLNYFSENFPSTVSEKMPAASLELPAELLSEKPEKKLSWDMSRGNWIDADFSELKNLHEKFSSSNLRRCKFIDSDLSGLLLRSNHVESCDFRGSGLNGSRIQNSHIVNNLFQDCMLQEAELSGSHIQGCNFTGADFTWAKVKSSSFQKNIMTTAVLNRTSFTSSDITDIIFEGTLEDCSFENCSFSRVTFQNATLINTFFKGKNLKGIRFTDCQADRMTYEFLKNGKADLSGITL